MTATNAMPMESTRAIGNAATAGRMARSLAFQ